ncbi:MAG: TonB-dependent receptor [Gemmatimonadales bacterium]|nr:TonB-dependent receptor [Gemmatimonadales bacterium]
MTSLRPLGIVAGVLAGLLVPLLVSGQTDSVPATAVVFGQVTGVFEGNSTPLPHALITAVTIAGRRTTLAETDGSYRLEGLSVGRLLLSVEHAGHAPLNVEVILSRNATVRADLALTGRPVPLDPVDVVGDTRIRDPSERDVVAPGFTEIEIQVLDLTPGVGSPGLLDAIQSMPGNDPTNATDVLYMRGSTTDLKLVLLDGAPVYTPFHAAGLIRNFEPAMLGSAQLHLGGAPARYDGGLTHILDIETRRPGRERLRASGSVDLISATTAIQGPLGDKAGFVASGRALHDLGSAPLRGDRPYGYRDVLVSVEAEPSEGHLLRGMGFFNREAVLLDFADAPDDANWSNRAASANYSGTVGDARLQLLAAASGYEASLPLQPAATQEDSLPEALLASAATDRVRLLAEVAWGAPGTETRVGISHDRIDAAFDARTFGSITSAGSRSSTHSTGVYIDGSRLLGPGVTIRAGLRADAFSVGGLRMAPRARVTWALDPQALLSVAAGRYHQPTRAPDAEVERTLAEVVDDGLSASHLLPVATADHVVVSLDQTLGSRVRMGLQGFWKRYEGLETAPDETVRSSGIDLRLSATGAESVFWFGYSLSWFWSTEDLSGYGSDFAGRHLLSAGLSGALAGPLRGEVRVAYAAGLPYTAIPFRSFGASGESTALDQGDPEGGRATAASADSPLVGGLDEEFLRIDIDIHALVSRRWAGKQWNIRPYVRVLNALDRRDALFYTFQPWRSDSLMPLAERPFLPILGVAFYF